MDSDAEYVMAVIQHRCPEIADAVVPVEVLAGIAAVLDAMAERLASLAELAASGAFPRPEQKGRQRPP
jgi:hypothetical protein